MIKLLEVVIMSSEHANLHKKRELRIKNQEFFVYLRAEYIKSFDFG